MRARLSVSWLMAVVVALMSGCASKPHVSPTALPEPETRVRPTTAPTVAPATITLVPTATSVPTDMPPPTSLPATATALSSPSPEEPTPSPSAPSPKGWIAFVSNREGNDEIYAICEDGSGEYRITENTAMDTLPAWLPGGRLLAFTSDRDGDPHTWILARAADSPEMLFSSSTQWRPVWSYVGAPLDADDPGPSLSILHTKIWDGEPDLEWVSYTDGRGRTRPCVTGKTDDRDAAISVDGTVSFVSRRDGNPEIYTQSQGCSGEPNRVTYNDADDGHPAFSSDGQWLAFQSDREGLNRIFKIRQETDILVAVTPPDLDCQHPTWSPDGTRLAFDAEIDGRREIMVIGADGDVLMQVTTQGGMLPSWTLLTAQ